MAADRLARNVLREVDPWMKPVGSAWTLDAASIDLPRLMRAAVFDGPQLVVLPDGTEVIVVGRAELNASRRSILDVLRESAGRGGPDDALDEALRHIRGANPKSDSTR